MSNHFLFVPGTHLRFGVLGSLLGLAVIAAVGQTQQLGLSADLASQPTSEAGDAAAVQQDHEAAGRGTDAPKVTLFRRVVQSKDRASYAIAALALRRWMIAHDPHYPKYHFVAPESWINDPNGPIFYRGKYHLFYQYSPIVAGQRSPMCWGHAVSSDLVHWEDWPVALWPDTPQDRGGVYSGNTVVADDGSLCALYTGNVAGHKETYGILARSRDDGLTWQKRVVMDNARRPNVDSPVHWDGFLWREAGQWRQLIGGTTGGADRQGAAWLWTSPDLQQWTLHGNIAPSIRFGPYWELPYLIPLGSRHVLLVGQGNPYWVGNYDAAKRMFTPQDVHPRQIDTGHYYSFNLNMTDDKGPRGARRQLMHGWVTGPPTPTQDVPYWQGAHSVPRVIRLEGDRVWQEPIPEIEKLRGPRRDLNQLRGDALEIVATFEPGAAKRFGLKLRVSADGREYTRVYFDPATRQFGVDGPTPARNARELKEVRATSVQDSLLPAGSAVTMRIFLDRSIVEVFVNGVAVTARTFPPADALGVELFSEEGQPRVSSLAAYEMSCLAPCL